MASPATGNPGIEWRPSRQVEPCRGVFSAQPRLDFPAKARSEVDYFTENDQYPALDAWVLEAFLRYLWPRRMIEIGSGFSLLVTARVNRDYFDDRLRFVCVEPHPRDFLLNGVAGITDLRIEAVQDTPFEVIEELGNNDILFI